MRSMLQTVHPTCATFEDHEGVPSRLLTALNSLWVSATYPFGGKGRSLRLHHASEISRSIAPCISLGSHVDIGKHTWFTSWVESRLKIIIEDECRIGARCTISVANCIHLERGVVLAPDVLLMDHAHAYEDVSRPIKVQGVTPGGRIRIGEGSRIGRGAAILCDKGELVLGRNCVVAPHAVVTRSFPPDTVLSGNPARSVQ